MKFKQNKQIGSLIFTGERRCVFTDQDGKKHVVPFKGMEIPIYRTKPEKKDDFGKTIDQSITDTRINEMEFNYKKDDEDNDSLYIEISGKRRTTPYQTKSKTRFGRIEIIEAQEKFLGEYIAKNNIESIVVEAGSQDNKQEKIIPIGEEHMSTVLDYATDKEQIKACIEKWNHPPNKRDEMGISRENTYILLGQDPKTKETQLFIEDTGSIVGTWVNVNKIGTEFNKHPHYRKSKDKIYDDKANKFYLKQKGSDFKMTYNYFERIKAEIQRYLNRGTQEIEHGDIIAIGREFYGNLFSFGFKKA